MHPSLIIYRPEVLFIHVSNIIYFYPNTPANQTSSRAIILRLLRLVRVRSLVDRSPLLRRALPDIPSPAPQHLDELRRQRRRERDADEDEGLVDRVCECELRCQG